MSTELLSAAIDRAKIVAGDIRQVAPALVAAAGPRAVSLRWLLRRPPSNSEHASVKSIFLECGVESGLAPFLLHATAPRGCSHGPTTSRPARCQK